MSETSDRVRALLKQGDDIRDAGLTTPTEVERFDDIAYGADPVWQSLDVYRPRAARTDGVLDPLPVIVSCHGGGWVYGDKERYQYYCMELARRGFAVVNFSYRLAPESVFPAAIEDANAVFTWLFAHAADYGIDTGHIFAVGDSAGGTLLATYAAILTNPAYAVRFPLDIPAGVHLTAIALNCGDYSLDDDTNELTASLMADLFGHAPSTEELRLASPLYWIGPDFPPVFVMTANDDFLRPQALPLATRLIEQEIPFELHVYGDKTHRLAHVFHCDVRSADAARANDDECAYFRRFL